MSNLKLVLLTLLTVILSNPYAHSQVTSPVKIRVTKSKGKDSLIRVSNSYVGELPPGLYTLSPSGPDDSTIAEDSRDKLISFSFESDFSSTTTTQNKVDTKVDTKQLSANFTYGWNKKRYEYGPFLNYSFLTFGTSDSKALSAGLFFDWNFIPNVEVKSWVPGVRVLAGIGQVDNSGLAKAYGSSVVQVGFITKYFYLHSGFAITGELAMKMESASPENTQIKSTSTIGRLGIINYF